MESPKDKALRYNSGKTRFSLNPVFANEQKAKVFTFGAQKYGDYNWRKGFKWTDVIDSLERHLNAFKNGEDFDPESGLYHLAHLACNADMLLDFYKTFPEGDNRLHWYINQKRIGLDIDEVLSDFVSHYNKRFNIETTPEYWNFDENIRERLSILDQDKEFWLTMPPKISPESLPFEPTCYITSRTIPNEWSAEWIAKMGFPTMPVHTVGFNESKVDACKKFNLDIFVDDRFENFVDLNKNGVCCFLFDAPHNKRYDVGYKRIKDLAELV